MQISDLKIVKNVNSFRLGKRTYLLKMYVTPFLVYKYLTLNFDLPNYTNGDERKIEWRYLLQFENNFIEIYDWKLDSVSVGVYEENNNEKIAITIANKIEELITKGSIRYRKDLKTNFKNASIKIIENTYYVYSNAANNLLKLARETKDKIQTSFDFKDYDSNNEYKLQKSDLCKASFFMYLSSFEAFLNILYEIYLKKEFRTQRLYDRFSREQIDLKFRLAPVYCDGFKVATISPDDERFKNFHRIFNLRNDFIHANPSKSLEKFIFKYDEYSFLVSQEGSDVILTNFDNLDIIHIELVKLYVEGAIELVFDSMEIRAKREFLQLIEEENIYLEIHEDGIIPML